MAGNEGTSRTHNPITVSYGRERERQPSSHIPGRDEELCVDRERRSKRLCDRHTAHGGPTYDIDSDSSESLDMEEDHHVDNINDVDIETVAEDYGGTISDKVMKSYKALIASSIRRNEGNISKTMPVETEPKRLKFSEQEEYLDGARKLNNLSDVLLQRVLSFLPTKEAVKTSVLSKRWEFLWTSIPILNLNCSLNSNRNQNIVYMDFVDRALALHDSSIYECSLACDVVEPIRVRRWITTVVRRNVQVFHIHLTRCKSSVDLPACFFTCSSLKMLSLSISCPLKLPRSFSFSNLMTLRLMTITFLENHPLQDLISACPLLKGLFIVKCNWINAKRVVLCVPKLLILSITDMEVAKDCWIEPAGSKIMILATCLKIFKYSGGFINEYCLYDASSLEKVEILMENVGGRSKIVAAYNLHELLRGASNVKELVLSKNAVEALNQTPEILAFMPRFSNLVVLTLNSEQVTFAFKGLEKILHHSPCLETLRFMQGIEISSDVQDLEEILNPVPQCFLSHLKRIEVVNFCGHMNPYVNLVKLLLNKAVVLDKLVVFYDDCIWSIIGTKLKHAHKELLKLPRVSEVVELKAN